MTTRILIPALALFVMTGSQDGRSGAEAQAEAQYDGFQFVDAKGNIRKPPDYRDRYQILGTFMVLNAIPMAAGAEPSDNEMHFTYASPGTAEFYRKNGKFADGTVLVKEVLATSHAQMTTGDAHWAKDMKQWFVMIKDAKGRFPGNRLWADGWGWALFKADAPDKQVATDYSKDCLGCHIPAKSTDWIYI